MNIGSQISAIRRGHQMTQEEFGKLFHVTRQTVSNWENEKSYPDLETLVAISDRFAVSLDQLIKEDCKMVQAIDKERILGTVKQEKPVIDFLTGAETGILASCLISPASALQTALILASLLMIGIGWHKRARCDQKVLRCLEARGEDGSSGQAPGT